MTDTRASSGVIGGLPYNRMGDGPPVVVLQGLTFDSRALSGIDARFMLRPYRALARHRTVYVVNRRPGLSVGTTLAEMAADYAALIRAEFEPPVEVIGLSSGGSIALHLAAEHPDTVRRLVIQDCGCRTTERAREWGRDIARLAEAGRWREASRLMIATIQPDNAFGRTLAWLVAPLMARSAPDDASEMVALIRAEEDMDFSGRLGEITVPTLVLSGEFDPFCGAELARETAAGIPHGRAVVYEGQRHGVRGDAFERDLVDFLVEMPPADQV